MFLKHLQRGFKYRTYEYQNILNNGQFSISEMPGVFKLPFEHLSVKWPATRPPFCKWTRIQTTITLTESVKQTIQQSDSFHMVGLSYGYSYSPNHSKIRPFKICTFLSGFQMVFDKMAAICPDFKRSGFGISDHIQNLDHLQPNLFLTLQNPDLFEFQIPTVIFNSDPHSKLLKWQHFVTGWGTEGSPTCPLFHPNHAPDRSSCPGFIPPQHLPSWWRHRRGCLLRKGRSSNLLSQTIYQTGMHYFLPAPRCNNFLTVLFAWYWSTLSPTTSTWA